MDGALLAHPAVAEAVSFAAPDEKYGEVVAAAVVLTEEGKKQGDGVGEWQFREMVEAHAVVELSPLGAGFVFLVKHLSAPSFRFPTNLRRARPCLDSELLPIPSSPHSRQCSLPSLSDSATSLSPYTQHHHHHHPAEEDIKAFVGKRLSAFKASDVRQRPRQPTASPRRVC